MFELEEETPPIEDLETGFALGGERFAKHQQEDRCPGQNVKFVF